MFFNRHDKNIHIASVQSKKLNALHSMLSSKLDWSDFILLSTMFLEEKIGDSIKNELHAIQVMYLKNQKTDAIQLIVQICRDHKEISDDERSLIQSQVSTLTDNPLALDSRRYFETRFALELWNSLNEAEFETITKLSALINEIDPTIDIPKIVQSLDDAELVVDRMEKCEHVAEIAEKDKSIKNYSALYKVKDRGKNRFDTKAEKVYSSNPGIMKSLAYNPFDEVTPATANRLADLALINENVEHGYSKSHPHVPFVNSLSGHTIIFIIVLERYLIKHQSDPKTLLQSDVDNLIKAFIAFTWKRGFHSFEEMVAILHDPSIQNIIAAHGIDINLPLDESILSSTYKKAAEYAYQVHLKRNCNQEVLSQDTKNLSRLNWSFDKVIYECPNIQDVLKYCFRERIIFVFDLDNTIIRPIRSKDLGSDQWFEKLLEHIQKVFPNDNDAFELALTLRNAIHKNIKVGAVESDTIAIIHLLQKCHIPVIALTSRGPNIIDTTEKQMREIKINFSKHGEPENSYPLLASGHQTAMYQNGIIYCDGMNKGIVLREYLKRAPLPKDIVVVDDSKKNLVRIQQETQSVASRITGLRYGYLDSKMSHFDFGKANEYLLKIRSSFSDSENEAIDKLNLYLTKTQPDPNSNCIYFFNGPRLEEYKSSEFDRYQSNNCSIL